MQSRTHPSFWLMNSISASWSNSEEATFEADAFLELAAWVAIWWRILARSDHGNTKYYNLIRDALVYSIKPIRFIQGTKGCCEDFSCRHKNIQYDQDAMFFQSNPLIHPGNFGFRTTFGLCFRCSSFLGRHSASTCHRESQNILG